MRRVLAAGLLLAGIICIGQQPRAQLTMTGVGGGFGVSTGCSFPNPTGTIGRWLADDTSTSSLGMSLPSSIRA